ncbi:molybdenum cofactor biosynthesis protein MoaC [Hydrocarboniphaga daqingensis]|uniref:Molybdenum cofactor biosynthesis protein MoaC n=1 Tax=Hydrocarboniphaga daqingensis TaxID=490188 RepID=A0A1M5JMS3_9GAMM|nr:bifunctional molybdenum cofactor biosynthesis protein MoaC/MoaB [Hydrocarboniphaga daqingensis]SHG41831.1 molybdenum cofactor biosynthesis protein MoaC [Hydrocarboniphaga daqingensis]
MQDITLKPSTLRSATAEGKLYLPADTIALVRGGKVNKGDVAECARIAALMGLKKTWELLPHCHPLAVLDARIDIDTQDDGILVRALVRTIASTGVEMEALTAVSVALLCAYDMLKPHAPAAAMRIGDVHLAEKKGGKTQYQRKAGTATAAVVVLSDTVAAGRKADTAGASVRDRLADAGFAIAGYDVLPDEIAPLRDGVQRHIDAGVDCIITVGGTGLSPRDRTIEAIRDLIDTEVPGFMEAARAFGQARTPYAMLSRGIAGMSGNSFIATFPGSRKGAEETLAAVLPALIHLIDVHKAQRSSVHDGGYQ